MGNIVSVESASKSYEERPLFSRISFGVDEGERIGLIGVNGSGKSTLLQTVAGIIPPDEGVITYRSGVTVEYLAQNPAFDSDATVLATVFRGDSPAIRTLWEYEQTLTELDARPTDARLQARLADLQQRMDAQSLWSLEAQAKSILTRLGVPDFGALMGTLSGGQRKRVAMARALIQPVDLLILDEPTNHIDNDTVAWLEEYLARYAGALLLVTHDRYFLDRVVSRIFELDGGALYSYTGGYSEYLEQKAEREEVALVREDRRQNLLRRELAWLKRGAKARTTKQKARIQRAEALQEVRGPAASADLEIEVAAHRLGRRIIEIKDVSKGFEGRSLIRGFSYTLLPGDRVGIIGPNGSGKSTLLNLIASRLAPDSGEVVTGQTVRLAFYEQESGYMDQDMRVIDYIKEVAEVVQTADGGSISASQMLERFLFSVRVQYTPIGKLSGGERRRLYLLRTLMGEPNVLMLDEPTNDLDIQTLTVLEEYLDQFPGVVIAVSHDRYFLDRVAEHLFALEGDGRVRGYIGGYSDYLEERREALAAAAPPVAVEKAPPAGESAAQKRTLKFTFKEQREFESIEADIADLEAKAVTLAAAVDAAATDYGRLQPLLAELAEVEAELNRKLDRWAQLTELAEAIEKQKAEKR